MKIKKEQTLLINSIDTIKVPIVLLSTLNKLDGKKVIIITAVI